MVLLQIHIMMLTLIFDKSYERSSVHPSFINAVALLFKFPLVRKMSPSTYKTTSYVHLSYSAVKLKLIFGFRDITNQGKKSHLPLLTGKKVVHPIRWRHNLANPHICNLSDCIPQHIASKMEPHSLKRFHLEPNAAVGLLSNTCCHEHVLPALPTLCQFLIGGRPPFKVFALFFKAIWGNVIDYLKEHLLSPLSFSPLAIQPLMTAVFPRNYKPVYHSQYQIARSAGSKLCSSKTQIAAEVMLLGSEQRTDFLNLFVKQKLMHANLPKYTHTP